MINQKYATGMHLGKGGFSEVLLVTDQNGVNYAAKLVRRELISPNTSSGSTSEKICISEEVLQKRQRYLSLIEKEALVLNSLQAHPNILNCFEHSIDEKTEFWEENGSYLILELCVNNSLGKFLRMTGGLSESIARFMFRQLCSSVEFMHWEFGIAHLDIKPQNILLDANFNVKLSDFGTAEICTHTQLISSRKGTPGYIAPEVEDFSLDTPFDAFKADIYSLGMTLNKMLGIQMIKIDKNSFEVSQKWSTHELSEDSEMEFSETVPDSEKDQVFDEYFSHSVVDLISAMTHPDPIQRPSIWEVMQSDWITDPCLEISPREVYSEMLSRKKFILNHQIN